MSDDDLRGLLEKVNRNQTLIVICFSISSFANVVFFVLTFLNISGGKESSPPVKIEANPENRNEITIGNTVDEIRQRAERRGYFTRTEFAEVMGFSVRTLDRRIAENRVCPVPGRTESGQVQIDLDAKVE